MSKVHLLRQKEYEYFAVMYLACGVQKAKSLSTEAKHVTCERCKKAIKR